MAASGFDIQSQCRICLSGYTKPRLLDCFHKFCTPCIEKLIEGKVKFNCPLCRADIIVPNDGASGFGICSNEKTKDEKQTEHSKLCELCDEGASAVVKCLDCDDYLCKICHKCHTKVKILKDHKYEFLIDPEIETSVTSETAIATCDIHGENLSLFCKPCNKVSCRACCTIVHVQHEVVSVIRAATRDRDVLMAAIGGLSAKVPILENTIEIAKTEEQNYYKHSRQIKQEIKAHAAGLKDVFCKTVDMIINNNLETVDQIQKEDIKQIETFIAEMETDKLSLNSMLQTTDELLQYSSDTQLLSLSTNVKNIFRRAIQKNYQKCLVINKMKFTSSELRQGDIISSAGKVIKMLKIREVQTTFPVLPIPDLQIVKDFRKISTFSVGASCLVSDKNGTVCLLKTSNSSCGLYTETGKLKARYQNINLGSNARLIKAADGTVFLWSQNSAKRLMSTMKEEDKVFEVPFDNAIACCFVNNGNLLVYNVTENSFVVVSEGNEILQEIKSENLSNILSSDNLYAARTKASNIIITQNTNVIVINDNGDIVNISTSKSGLNLQDICIDEYENVFVAESGTPNILLYCPGGHFQRVVLNSGLSNTHLAINDCGHLWISDQTNTNVYSYL